ncbi:hypothetical protein AOY62_06025 [Escherichia coli]|nr:hypothetical protein AOY62_06025 [Escherichia coli]
MSKTIAAMVLIRLKIDETFSEGRGDAQGCAARARLTGIMRWTLQILRYQSTRLDRCNTS